MTPLSEYEKRQLRLLESQLHAEDPVFVSTMQRMHAVSIGQRNSQGREMSPYLLGIIVGIGALIVGLVTSNFVPVASGAATITYCLGSCILIYKKSKSTTKTQSVFMENLKARWEERKRNDGRSRFSN